MLEQITHSLAVWIGALIPISIIAMVLLLRWKDAQLAGAKAKLMEQKEDASNEVLKSRIKAQETEVEQDDRAIKQLEARLSARLGPGNNKGPR